MNSLNNQTHFFDLPYDVLGQILHHLNLETGSKNFVNKADIPIVMKYARSLACSSTWMNDKINHQEITSCFLESLSDKYGQTPPDFAVLFNTMGARQYIWNYVKKVGDDKNYQIIQEIYDLASEVLYKAKKAPLKFERFVNPHPSPTFYDGQTKQGFVLANTWSPSYLITPFGRIDIYYSGNDTKMSAHSITEMFIKNLKGTFEKLDLRFKTEEIYQIISSGESTRIRKIYKTEIKNINIDDIESYKGSQDLIFSCVRSHVSLYNIHQVNGKKTPEVEYFDRLETSRSPELINTIWKMLERNKLGLYPIEKEIKNSTVVSSLESEVNQTSVLKNIVEVIKFCADCILQLYRQPHFKGDTWLSIPSKLLVLENISDAYLIVNLNECSSEFIDWDSYWPIESFGLIGQYLRYLNGKNLGHGIEIRMYRKVVKFCDSATLYKAYESVVKKMSQNWQRSVLKDYPNIMETQSEEEYELFVKIKVDFKFEDYLIYSVAKKLGIADSIYCGSRWMGNFSGVYLWIKKDKVDKVLGALNIQR